MTRRSPFVALSAAVVLAGTMAGVTLVAAAPIASDQDLTTTLPDETSDASAAVRYDMSSGSPEVIGEILPTLWDRDDAVATFALPFPINYFGQKFTDVCISTNGLVYPVNNAASCSPRYDLGPGDLALASGAPAMAVLALDLDGDEELRLSDGRNIDTLTQSLSVSNHLLAGGIMTVTASGSVHNLQTGDHVEFLGTGTVLATGHTYPVTIIDANRFSIPLPGVTDLDPMTAGDQTAAQQGRWVYSNGVGTRAVYAGETLIGGQPAYVVTWYRYPHDDDDNPTTRSATLQLVLTKGQSGDATAGWDFNVEFNIGSMTDDENGYRYDNPSSGCAAFGYPGWTNPSPGVWVPPAANLDQRHTCRWGMGFASYRTNLALTSIVISNGIATLTTSAPHGIDGVGFDVGGLGVRIQLPSSAALGDLSGDRAWATVVDATTLRIDTGSSSNAPLGAVTDLPLTDLTASGLTANASDVYELFAGSPIPDLIDPAGATSLVRNSLNTTVLGRYTFGMTGGRVTHFRVPLMTGGPTFVPALQPMPVLPSLPAGVAELVVQPVPTTPPPTTPPSTTAPASTPTTTVPPAPARSANGELPDLGSAETLVTENGQPVAVELFVENDEALVLRSQDFELRLRGACTTGCTITEDTTGRETIHLDRNGGARVSGFGFLPGSLVHVWIFSEPRYLGALPVAADGTYDGTFPLDAIEVGGHTLQANGYSFDNLPRSANLGIVVVDSNVPTRTPTALPATGSGDSSVTLAVGVLALGALLLAVTRRRNRTA